MARNLHVPLSDDVYAELRSAADESGEPATVVARRAIAEWLRQRRKQAVREALARYAAGEAGSNRDLDEELERAGLERLHDEGDDRASR